MDFQKIKNISQQIRGVSYKSKDVGKDPSVDSVPVLRSNSITEEGLKLNNLVYVPKAMIKKNQYLKKNDILITASSGSKKIVGRSVRINEDMEASFGAFCKVLRPNKEINPLLFFYFFKTKKYRSYIENIVQGANINNLKNEHLGELKFPIIDKPDVVAKALNDAFLIYKKRKEGLKLLDEFLNSTFLEMFGDPALNPKAYKTDLLDNLTQKIGSGSTPKGGSKIYQESGSLFIRSQNVLMNELRLDNAVFISDDIHNSMKNTWVKKNDLLLNITGASIGRVAVYSGEDDIANVNQHVCIIRVMKKEINPIFISYLIAQNNYQKKIMMSNIGGTRQAFNFKTIKTFEIILPKIKLQNKFADIVKQTELLKSQYQESKKELDNLFNSLMQRAFKGEI
jgi:type I restriction enzyme, S subunit